MWSTQLQIPLLLCLLGFLKEFRPSKPFGVAYMAGPRLNLTTTQIDEVVLPMRSYSYMSLLIVILLLTDLLRYKPVIVVGGLAGVTTYALLTFGHTIDIVIMSQCTHGLFMASEVAYSTYMYARLNKGDFQKVTGLTRTALLLGRALSGLLAQALISSKAARPYALYFITLACQIAAAMSGWFLPPVSKSLYFHRRNSVVPAKDCKPSPGCPSYKARCRAGLHLLWIDFQTAYTSSYVLKWSLWWAFTMCGFLQLTTYCKVLWKVMIDDEGETLTSLYNGAAEATGTITGAMASLYCSRLGGGSWHHRADVLLALCSLLHGIFLYVSATTSSLLTAYCCYVAFVMSYHFVITVATSEVARSITDDSYGLVFGINTFLALVTQSALAMAVLSPEGFALPIRMQFVVYAGFHTVLGVVYTFIAVHAELFRRDRKYIVNY